MSRVVEALQADIKRLLSYRAESIETATQLTCRVNEAMQSVAKLDAEISEFEKAIAKLTDH